MDIINLITNHSSNFLSGNQFDKIIPIISALIVASLVVAFISGIIRKVIGLAIIVILFNFFAHGSSPDMPTWGDLNSAMAKGDISVIETAVQNGANIDFQPLGVDGKVGNTLLMSAISMGKYNTALQLLQLGANPCVRNGLNQTPLSLLPSNPAPVVTELANKLAQCVKV